MKALGKLKRILEQGFVKHLPNSVEISGPRSFFVNVIPGGNDALSDPAAPTDSKLIFSF